MIGWLFPSRQRAYGYGRRYGQRVGAAVVVKAVGAISLKGRSKDFIEGVALAFSVAEKKLNEADLSDSTKEGS
tara:strand:- start:137 stop:355 length:219 start_codon:yes stop_codon:yes gene_type:complete